MTCAAGTPDGSTRCCGRTPATVSGGPCAGATTTPSAASPESSGWEVAASLDDIIPLGPLAKTLEHALLDELATGKEGGNEEDIVYGIMPRIGKMLGWLVRHDPAKAGFVMSNVVGEADRRLQIPRGVAEYSLKVALEQDGGLDHDALAEFLRLVLSPAE